MNAELYNIWVYLSESPLLALTLTLAAYRAGYWLFERSGRSPFANPVLIAVALLAGFLVATDTSYRTYFEGAQFVHFLLGPATVALAVPLFRHWAEVRRSLAAIAVSLLVGSLTAVATAVGIAHALGAGRDTLLALAPKSATAPIAMGIAERLGGQPSLTAVLVILTGMVGAIAATALLNALRISDWRARGFAVGLASHGIGTARALAVHPVAGAFAGLAMGLNGIATALLLPLAYAWLAG